MKLRIEDLMLEISLESAIVDFQEIMDAVAIVPDDDRPAPWDAMDGWEHELVKARSDRQRGYIGRFAILAKEQGWYEYARNCGQSKQVAREYAAFQLGRMIDQLAEWRRNGYQYFGLTCEFKGAFDSIWGVEPESVDDWRRELAENVADALEKQGYSVNRPPRKKQFFSRLSCFDVLHQGECNYGA